MGIMADQTLRKISELEGIVVETVWKNGEKVTCGVT